jgi:glycerol-3-phosphate dehydrogenase
MESFSEKLYISEAVIRYAVQYEMAMTLEDVLARRIRALFLDSEEAVRLAPKVAKIMAEDLGKDAAWVSEQCNLFINLSSNYNI